MGKNRNVTAQEAGSAVVNAADLLKASTEQDQPKEPQFFEGAEVINAEQIQQQEAGEQQPEVNHGNTTKQQVAEFTEAPQTTGDHGNTTKQQVSTQEPELSPIIPAIVVDTGTPQTATAAAKGFINQNDPALNSQAAAVGNVVPTSLRERMLAQRQAAVEGAAELSQALQKTLSQVPPANQSDIIRIRQYCVTMAPGRSVSELQGAQEQVALYRSIQNIVNRQEEYFQPLFSALLKVFASEAKGAMCDTQRNRFDSHIALSKEDRKAFRNVTHLLSAVADPKSRSLVLKTVNLEAALEYGFTEEGRNRVIGFLG